MSLTRNSCYGLLVVAMASGIALGEPRLFMVREGGENGAPSSGPTKMTMSPGETATVTVWMVQAGASSVGGYQIAIPGFATANEGAGGTVEYVDTPGLGGSVFVDQTHIRWLFTGVGGVSVFYSETGLPAGFAFIALAPFGVGAQSNNAYLGQFDVTASADACGSFTLEFLPDGSPPNGGTAITNNTGGEVVVTFQPLVINIDAICPGEPRLFMVRAGEQDQAPAEGPTKLSMDPGETVDIELWLADTAPDLLGGYQIVVPGFATAGPDGGGAIEYVDTAGPGGSVVVDAARPEWVFQGVAGVGLFYAESQLPAGFGLIAFPPPGTGVPVTLGYMGEFQFTATTNACGTFTLDFVPNNEPPYGGTGLTDETGIGQLVAALRQLVINVNAVCPPPEQACCFEDGSCDDLDPDDCTAQNGTPQGKGTECATTECPQPPEACCFEDGSCDDLPAGDCADQGGIAQGPGTDCATTECPLPPEACCFPDGDCQDLPPDDCDGQGGTAQGAGTSCGVEGCPPPPEIVHATGQPGETQPCTGYVDPKRESDNGVDINEGLQELTLVFSMPVFSIGGGALGPNDFEVAETGIAFNVDQSQEVPPSGSAAHGYGNVSLNPAGTQLSIHIVHNLATVTAGHIHRAAPGVNGPVVFPFPSAVSPINAVWNLTAADVADLMAGNLYANLHSAAFPGGEIRGQIVPNAVATVDDSGNPTVHLTLERPISVQEWTTVRAIVQNAAGVHILNQGNLGPNMAEPDRHDVAFLPCDVDQNETCGPFDLLLFRQFVNDVSDPPCGVESDYLDIDRDGAVGPFDLLAFRRLVNGISPATRAWSNVSTNHSQP